MFTIIDLGIKSSCTGIVQGKFDIFDECTVFQEFLLVSLVMSCEGQCIFNNPPQTMSKLFKEVGLLCLKFSNISDFGLEVASGEYWRPKLLTLSTIMKIEAMN